MCPHRRRRRRRVARAWTVRLFLWCLTFSAGALTGISLAIRAQVATMRYAREQLDDLNIFTKFLAKMTFLWRALDEKLVLAIGDIPESYLVGGELVANFLFGLATVLLLASLLVRRKHRRRRA